MKFILQIFLLLLTWFTNLNATPIFSKVVLPSLEFPFPKTENVKEESAVKLKYKTLKMFTSKGMQKAIEENMQESRKEWILWLMERVGLKNSNVKNRQFWQQNNKPPCVFCSRIGTGYSRVGIAHT